MVNVEAIFLFAFGLSNGILLGWYLRVWDERLNRDKVPATGGRPESQREITAG